MKVDKAVCTNDTLEDLTKTIKYEAVFTTLVENKILAIKRDCEEKKKAKKQKRKSFGRILFGRRIFGGSSKKSTQESSAIDVEKGISDGPSSSGQQLSLQGAAQTTATGSISSNVIEPVPPSEKSKTDVESEVDITSLSSIKVPPIDPTVDDSNGSNENGSLACKGTRDMVVEVITHREGFCYDDSDKCDPPTDKDSVVLTTAETEKNLDVSSLGSVRVDENTSTIADGSLTSIKDSIESLSFPSSRCTVSAGLATTISYEKERTRLRLLEAKSISAQCSPILPRQKLPLSSAQTQTHTKLQSQVSYSDNQRGYDAIRFFSRQTTSEDSANLTISTLLNEADSVNALGERKSKSTSLLVIADKDNKKAINRLDSNSIVSYQSNPLVRGLISSFNQLTTTSSYFPVITTTVTTVPKSPVVPLQSVDAQPQTIPAAIVPTTTVPCDTTKLQRMASTSTGSSVAPTGCCATKSASKESRRMKPDWQTMQTGSDDEYRKRKRKYKRYHRCSDPVLVYPSSGGLQHCILSMPPNQPIQFHYNDDFVYDMTLQVEAGKNGELQAIVPSQRSKRHRHHKHKKRNRHKKPKILVHDLDTQSVKVIDPDDLPQRARWTIIATACLLLIMCLMLVGITLRMAPIIDDMALFILYCYIMVVLKIASCQ